LHNIVNILSDDCSYNVSLRRGDDCRVSLKRENKTAQTLSIVVGGFIACWLLFFIVYLITPFLPATAIPEDMMKWLTWLGERNDIISRIFMVVTAG